MKQTIKKALITTACIATLSSAVYAGTSNPVNTITSSNITGDSKNVIINIFGEDNSIAKNERMFPGIPVNVNVRPETFMDFYYGCTNSLNSLVMSYSDAYQLFMMGQTAEAIQLLQNAINSVDPSSVGSEFYWQLPPYTATAIVYVKKYINKVFPVIDSVFGSQDVSPIGLKTQLKFMLLYKMVSLVTKVNETLDQYYYEAAVNDYVSNMGNQFYNEMNMRIPAPYFDRVKELAKDFLNVHLGKEPNTGYTTQELMGSNTVELVSAKYIAEITRQLLMKSPLRRQFCQVISGLYNLELRIGSYLNYPANYKVEVARNAFQYAKDVINAAEFGRGCRFRRPHHKPCRRY